MKERKQKIQFNTNSPSLPAPHSCKRSSTSCFVRFCVPSEGTCHVTPAPLLPSSSFWLWNNCMFPYNNTVFICQRYFCSFSYRLAGICEIFFSAFRSHWGNKKKLKEIITFWVNKLSIPESLMMTHFHLSVCVLHLSVHRFSPDFIRSSKSQS